MSYVLGVDVGGTHTVCLLADENEHILGRGEAGPANMTAVGLQATVAEVKQAVAGAWHTAGLAPQAAAAACLGVSGVDRPGERSALEAAIRSLGLTEQLSIVTDGYVALVAGSPTGVGVVVVAGTGAIAWGRNARGEARRASGWGYILGDEGSAFDIGLSALRAVLRAHDGRTGPTLLTRLIMDHWRLHQTDELIAIVYKPKYPRPEIAALAPLVEQAARQGDAIACDIYANAAQELALAATAVIRGLHLQDGPVNVVLSGGVWNAGELIVAPFLSAVRQAAPGAQAVRLKEEPAIGAVHLAAGMLT